MNHVPDLARQNITIVYDDDGNPLYSDRVVEGTGYLNKPMLWTERKYFIWDSDGNLVRAEVERFPYERKWTKDEILDLIAKDRASGANSNYSYAPRNPMYRTEERR